MNAFLPSSRPHPPPSPRRAAGRAWLPALAIFALALGAGVAASLLWMRAHPVVVKGLPSDSAASLDAQRRALPVPATGAAIALPAVVTQAPDAPRIVADTPPPSPLPTSADADADGAQTRQGAQPDTAAMPPVSSDHGPRLSEHATPTYPREALRAGITGSVRVRIAIDAQGNVVDVSIVHGSGSGLLDRAALDAVRGWHYQPAIQGGQPVPSTVEVPVDFRLDGT